MKKGRWKKILKIAAISLLLIFFGVVIFVYQFAKPYTDAQILEKLTSEKFHPNLRYVDFENKKVRIIEMQKAIDTALPILVFVHGSPGSSMDFKKYLLDESLHQKVNIIAYDRIGYGNENTGEVLNSIALELEVLKKVIGKNNSQKVILVGYSYGATIVMAAIENYKQKIALAPSVRGDLEPMFWVLKLYEWNATRTLIPEILQAASKEKLKHVTELPTLKKQWNKSNSKVLVIHGTSDKIVPFENSLFLEKIMDKDKFSLIPIKKGTHALVWTDFELIKSEILKTL
jgi:pimeloyl-ACP methyl ester carboxylesterase